MKLSDLLGSQDRPTNQPNNRQTGSKGSFTSDYKEGIVQVEKELERWRRGEGGGGVQDGGGGRRGREEGAEDEWEEDEVSCGP